MGAVARGGSKPGPALSARYAGRGRWRAANRNVGHHTRLCRLGPAELSGQALDDPAILSLSQRLEMVEDPALSDRFPGRLLARVQVETRGGHLFDSGEVEATWEADSPPTDSELRQKFHWLARALLPESEWSNWKKSFGTAPAYPMRPRCLHCWLQLLIMSGAKPIYRFPQIRKTTDRTTEDNVHVAAGYGSRL